MVGDSGNLPRGVGETANGEFCATSQRKFFGAIQRSNDKGIARTKNGLADEPKIRMQSARENVHAPPPAF